MPTSSTARPVRSVIARATCVDWAMAIGLCGCRAAAGAVTACWSLARPPGVERPASRVGRQARVRRATACTASGPGRTAPAARLRRSRRPGAPASSLTRTVGACSSLSMTRRIGRSISRAACGSRSAEPAGQPGQLGVHHLAAFARSATTVGATRGGAASRR